MYNQQRIGTQPDQLREVLNVGFIMSMIYLFGIVTFIGRVWRDRQKRASATTGNQETAWLGTLTWLLTPNKSLEASGGSVFLN